MSRCEADAPDARSARLLGGARRLGAGHLPRARRRLLRAFVRAQPVCAALVALDGAACHFGVSRETLTIALATSSSRARFARAHHVDSHELENAVRRGLERAVDDAERAGAISGFRATALRFAAEH